MDPKPGPTLPYATPPASGAASLSPEDIEKLVGELASLRQALAHKDAALNAANLKIQALALEPAHHKRMRFGQRSEALAAAGQRELFEETVVADLAAIGAELEEARHALNPKTPRKPRARAGRQPLPAHLPRVEHRHEPESCACGQCGGQLTKIGEDANRAGKDHSAENLAAVRRISLNVIRHNDPGSKVSLRRRKRLASLNDDYRLRLIFGEPSS